MPLSLDGSSGITGAINVQATGSILAGVTTVAAGSTSAPSISPSGDSNTGIFFPSADTVAIAEGGTEILRIDSTGSTLINTTVQTTSNGGLSIATNSSGTSTTPLGLQNRSIGNSSGVYISHRGLTNVGAEFDYNYIQMVADNTTSGTGSIRFHTANGSGPAERVRIDNSGRLLVGTSSARDQFFGGIPLKVQIEGDTTPNCSLAIVRNDATADSSKLILAHARGTSYQVLSNNDAIGDISWQAADGNKFLQGAHIRAFVDGSPGVDDMPTRLVFSITADGASSPTQRMVIRQNGILGVNVDSPTFNYGDAVGFQVNTSGDGLFMRNGAPCLYLNRKTSDGDLLVFAQDGANEGTISVSGTTVSYNGAHLSRWSQLINIDPHDKSQRPEILRGTVMSNLDEMCQWIDPETGEEQDNEQLNKTQISNVEDDSNVAGVFQSWDDDDDTWVNDYYLAMTGDFVIRIAADTTVSRGDLLISAGDGTAKPQGDRYLKDSTIAKVTSTHVTCTYEDGSYCVPCVLMAC